MSDSTASAARVQCRERGMNLKLADAFVDELLNKFGPAVVNALFDVLESQQKPEFHGHLKLDPLGWSWLKALLVNTLVNNEKTLEGWLANGEDVLFAALLAVVGKNNLLLSAALAGLKAKLLRDNPDFNASSIELVIDTLKSLPG